MSTRESKLLALNIAHLRLTRNSLGQKTRQAAIELLDIAVASLTDLSLAARQAHWNVRGANFSSLHKLFGEISTKLAGEADVLAERSAALGGIPRGTAQAVAAITTLRVYPALCVEGSEHLDELGVRLANLGPELRQSIYELEQQGDPVTVHLMTDAASVVDKLLWLLESHQPIKSGPEQATGGGPL